MRYQLWIDADGDTWLIDNEQLREDGYASVLVDFEGEPDTSRAFSTSSTQVSQPTCHADIKPEVAAALHMWAIHMWHGDTDDEDLRDRHRSRWSAQTRKFVRLPDGFKSRHPYDART